MLFYLPQKEMPAEAGTSKSKPGRPENSVSRLSEKPGAKLITLRLRLRLWHRHLFRVYRSHFRTVITSQISHTCQLLFLHLQGTLHHHHHRRALRKNNIVAALHHRSNDSYRRSNACPDARAQSRAAASRTRQGSYTCPSQRGPGNSFRVRTLRARLLNQAFFVFYLSSVGSGHPVNRAWQSDHNPVRESHRDKMHHQLCLPLDLAGPLHAIHIALNKDSRGDHYASSDNHGKTGSQIHCISRSRGHGAQRIRQSERNFGARWNNIYSQISCRRRCVWSGLLGGRL